jgi:hypothetical protein
VQSRKKKVMPFKAGEQWTGNKSGRPVGALSKKTKESLTRRDQWLTDNFNKFHDAWLVCSPRSRAEIYARIWETTFPKQEMVSAIDWGAVSDEALDEALQILENDQRGEDK